MNDENTESMVALVTATERSHASADPVRGRDVQIDKLFRARCHRPGCGWTGGEHANYQDANAERHTHLSQHMLAAGGAQ